MKTNHPIILLGLISSAMALSPAKAETITMGSSNFGAKLTSTYDDALKSDSYEAHLRSKATGRILRKSVKLAASEVNFNVSSDSKTHAWGNLKIRGLPVASWDKRFNGNGSFTTAPFLSKEFAASKKFGFGPFKLKVQSDATISISATGDIQYEWSRTHPPIIHAHNLGPIAQAAASAELSADVGIASAGIEGAVKLCDYAEYLNVDTLPSTGGGHNELNVNYSARFDSTSTDGTVKIWAKVKYLPLVKPKKVSKTLAEFHGAPRSVMLASGTRRLALQ